MVWYSPNLAYFLIPAIYFVACFGVTCYLFLYRRHDSRLFALTGFIMLVLSSIFYVIFLIAPVGEKCVDTYLNNTTIVRTCTYMYHYNYYDILTIIPVLFGIIMIVWWIYLEATRGIEFVVEHVP